ncbi:hypothetical protein [Paracoccus aminovorans]|uniref:hypothetical protein n=1 Tax=Paracoccus aminovorans TaxID=34004 RepID=UPI0007811593|nr:hypothetical protein [Paracoccus aminovorans]MDQ7775715.1 hypothetical protein [Paracoccus aminovorans]
MFSLKAKDYADSLRLVRLAAAEVDGRFAAHRRMIALERASLVDELTPDEIEAARASRWITTSGRTALPMTMPLIMPAPRP